MFRFIKQMFIVLLSFSGSLATTYVSLNNEPHIIRLTLIDLNFVQLNYYSFRVSIDEYNGSYNALDDLSTKLCVPSKTKYIIIKVLNLTTKKNESKTLVSHNLCNWKCKFNSTTCISNQKLSNDTGQCECKKYRKCKKDYSCTCICENGKHLKNIIDNS